MLTDRRDEILFENYFFLWYDFWFNMITVFTDLGLISHKTVVYPLTHFSILDEDLLQYYIYYVLTYIQFFCCQKYKHTPLF